MHFSASRMRLRRSEICDGDRRSVTEPSPEVFLKRPNSEVSARKPEGAARIAYF